MKVKDITGNCELHIDNSGLKLISNGNEILSGFKDVGEFANGLVPVYFKEAQEFKYFDVESEKVYSIKGVDWVSGFHFVGSDLNYFNHNYKTDPIAKMKGDQYVFSNKSTDLKEVLKDNNQIKIMPKMKSNWDEALQEFVKFASEDEEEYIISKDNFSSLLDNIKYYRIVGVGKLGKSLDFGSPNISLENGLKYNKSLYSLSQKDGKYGVIDIRTNKLVVEPIYTKINVFPGLILHTNEDGDGFTSF